MLPPKMLLCSLPTAHEAYCSNCDTEQSERTRFRDGAEFEIWTKVTARTAKILVRKCKATKIREAELIDRDKRICRRCAAEINECVAVATSSTHCDDVLSSSSEHDWSYRFITENSSLHSAACCGRHRPRGDCGGSKQSRASVPKVNRVRRGQTVSTVIPNTESC